MISYRDSVSLWYIVSWVLTFSEIPISNLQVRSRFLSCCTWNDTAFRSTISRTELEKELEDQIEEETESNEVSEPENVDTTTSSTTTEIEKTATTSTTTESPAEGEFQICFQYKKVLSVV